MLLTTDTLKMHSSLSTNQPKTQPGTLEFLELIKTGDDVNALEKYIKENNQIISRVIHNRIYDGSTFLILAARERRWLILQRLLKIPGINVNAADNNKDTALTLAASGADLQTVQELMNDGADVLHQNKAGNTAIGVAMQQGNTLIVEALIEVLFTKAIQKGQLVFIEKYLIKNPQTLILAEHQGNTAFVLAALYNNLDRFQAICARGISIKFLQIALLLAAQKGHLNIVEVLLTLSNINIDKPNNNGDTPVMLAASQGHLAVVHVLLNKGADPYYRNKLQITPMDQALASGQREIVDLLERAPNEFLLQSVSTGNLERVQKYVEEINRYGKIIKVVNEYGDTPLLLAVRKKNLSMVKALVTLECFINETNNMGENALTYAVLNGDLILLEILLNVPGIQIDFANKRTGVTVLMKAAQAGQKNIVETLVKNGADLRLKNMFHMTAEQIAIQRGHSFIAKLLNEAKQQQSEYQMVAFLNRQVLNQVPARTSSGDPSDGGINPALKIFGTTQNKMDNGRWEIFVLLQNEVGALSMRSGIKSQTWDCEDLNVEAQFNFFKLPFLEKEIKKLLLDYRYGHPSLARDFTKLDHNPESKQDYYETLPVFAAGWLLRHDCDAQKRIQVFWSSGRYGVNRNFSPTQEHLLHLSTAYHLMSEYGKDFIIEFYAFSSITISCFITKKADGGQRYDWDYWVQKVSHLMAVEGQQSLTTPTC